MQEKGEGLELRMLVKLRVQNPNSTALSYDGAYVKAEVQGKTFATGVSDTRRERSAASARPWSRCR